MTAAASGASDLGALFWSTMSGSTPSARSASVKVVCSVIRLALPHPSSSGLTRGSDVGSRWRSQEGARWSGLVWRIPCDGRSDPRVEPEDDGRERGSYAHLPPLFDEAP